ncbi:A/G-specific adenine glycosylase [Stratiformator vulcanicus]|uniref:A/G-specific adenine glycosylase n=1 Tax=Stratiformator vulcanicus TaxID=2527980 RepID=UPI00287773D8|nr:A/G-specific adenine glycosylase [Stratiformator vulcanicus]
MSKLLTESPAKLKRFREKLLAWYAERGRDLPWRRTCDPYAIWISEIMLQQTTVAAVIPYFERFLDRFPTVQQLAAAEEADVLKLWEGLGYYSRARNLHAAAQDIATNHAGSFPRTAEELQSLKGIGRYTAGAIASFAFDERAPIVEANTQRLYCRLLGERGDPKSTGVQKTLWQFAETILPKNDCGLFNQALMELGGTVCTIESPSCGDCPASRYCVAARHDLQQQIPAAKRRSKPTPLVDVTVAVRKDDRYLIRQRGLGEWWTGLWDFPRLTLDETLLTRITLPSVPARSSRDQPNLFTREPVCEELRSTIEQFICDQTGVSCRLRGAELEVRHAVTRYKIRLFCCLADYQSGRLSSDQPLKWVRVNALSELAFSQPGRRFADRLIEIS